MGGYVEQISATSNSHVQSQSSSQLKSQVEGSFSASLGGWGATVTGSIDYATASDKSTEQQQEYESSTSKSTIKSFGGLPGSFGPELSSTW